jgi:hypothetical protein
MTEPSFTFNPRWNYRAEEIASITGIPIEAVRLAGQRREISCVCTMCRDGINKARKGDKCQSWAERWLAQHQQTHRGPVTDTTDRRPAQADPPAGTAARRDQPGHAIYQGEGSS